MRYKDALMRHLMIREESDLERVILYDLVFMNVVGA